MSELTPEQLAVVQSHEPRLTVRAAAGSGKTKTLVARFLKHVTVDGLRPDQILTITYTNKAAAEMKRKIVSELRAHGLRAEAQVAETGPIQTVHAFYERVLRENAVSAGVDPKFEVMGDGHGAGLRLEALRQELRSTGLSPEADAYLRHRAGKHDWGMSGALMDAVAKDVSAVLESLRGSAFTREALNLAYGSVDAFRAFAQQTFESLQIGSEWAKIAKLLDVEPPTPASLAERESIHSTCGLVQIALGTWERLERQMDLAQEFDFAYLERLAVELVERNPATAERIRGQYRVVLVDEAQDLNPIQYRLLKAMDLQHEMLVGDPQQSIYSFRQADYQGFLHREKATQTLRLSSNFRSQPEILRFIDTLFGKFWHQYDAMECRLPTGGKVEIWQQNAFDSRTVTEMVQTSLAASHAPGGIVVLVRTARQAKKVQRGLMQVGIASRIAGGTEGFFSRLHVRDFANVLEALVNPEADLELLATLRSPVVGLSLDATVLLAACRLEPRRSVTELLDDLPPLPEEDLARIAAFREWFDPLRKVADRLSAWEVISEVLKKTSYLNEVARESMNGQAVANIRKLLMLAVEDRELGPLEFAEKIRRIQSLRDREGEAPAVEDDTQTVQIMTIHKAKGLEFPVVIAPDMFHRLDKLQGSGHLQVDARIGLVSGKFGKLEPALTKWLKKRRIDEERAEAERVLYVALTRAQSVLKIMAHPEAKPNTFAGQVGLALELHKEGQRGFQVVVPTGLSSDSKPFEERPSGPSNRPKEVS